LDHLAAGYREDACDDVHDDVRVRDDHEHDYARDVHRGYGALYCNRTLYTYFLSFF
jgi:hypothetical protein